MKKLSKKLFFKFFSLLIIFYSPISFGAACCGSGFAIPSIITGDEKAQFTSSLTHSDVVADVSSSGVWQRHSSEQINTLKIEAAHIFNERWQAGISLPVQQRKKPSTDKNSSTGISDISTQIGYEYLTDWDYSSWRPRAVGYFSVVFPTGKSIYESDTLSGIDSRGRGFWSFGIGSIFTKNYNEWDFFSNLELHKSLNKSVNTSQAQGEIKPGVGGSMSLGVGYNIKEFRVGVTSAWNYEEALDFDGTVSSSGDLQRYATMTFSLSYLLKNNFSTAISYSDQTILESPSNTSLSRSVVMLLQKKWNR